MPALLAASAGDGLLLSTHLMLPVTISGSKVSLESFVVRPDHPGRFPLVVITHGPRAWMAMRSSAISCTSSAIAWNKSGNETANPSSVRAELSSAANCARCKYRLTSQGADGRPDRRRFAGEQYRAMVRSASALHGSVGATGLPGPSRLQTDTGLIAFTELDPGRLQSSTQLVDGPCIGRYRPRRSLDPLDGLQRHTRFVRELALFNPKHRPSSSDLFTG